MKKVIAINSSKRKKNTYNILLEVKRILIDYDIDVEIVSLFDLDINECLGCEACILKGNCVINDDMDSLLTKLVNADGIILSSPVYLRQVSGKMKTFIDRTCAWFHRPELTGKPILSITTTKGSGLNETLKYLNSISEQWGAISGGKIGRNIRNINKEIELKEINEFITLIKNPDKYRPSLKNLINFEVQKSLAKHLLQVDFDYWQARGWNQQSFYYQCNINPINKFIAVAFGKFLRRQMSKSAANDIN